MTLEQAAQEFIAALEDDPFIGSTSKRTDDAINSIRAALAAPVGEGQPCCEDHSFAVHMSNQLRMPVQCGTCKVAVIAPDVAQRIKNAAAPHLAEAAGEQSAAPPGCSIARCVYQVARVCAECGYALCSWHYSQGRMYEHIRTTNHPPAKASESCAPAAGPSDACPRCDPMTSPASACEHRAAMPTFDVDAAKGLSDVDVRQRWPRFFGECPECGQRVILYASYAHYVYGDW